MRRDGAWRERDEERERDGETEREMEKQRERQRDWWLICVWVDVLLSA